MSSLPNDALRARVASLEAIVKDQHRLIERHWASLQAAWLENEHLRASAQGLDRFLLRFAFDGGALSEEVVSGLGVDPWGTLGDFRAAFGLEPTMSADQYGERMLQ